MLASDRLVPGAGFLLVSVYFTKMVADWFDGHEAATAMSIFVISWPFGIAMGQVGQTWMAGLYGWRVTFLVAAAYSARSAAAVFGLYRAPGHIGKPATRRTAWLLPREWLLIALAGVAWAVFNAGFVVWLSFAAKVLEAQGSGVLSAASVVSIGSWIMIFSGAACGQIVDRFGHGESILAIAMGAAVTALSLLAVPGAGLFTSLLFGLIAMAPAGIIFALASTAVAPERRAFGMGVFFTIY